MSVPHFPLIINMVIGKTEIAYEILLNGILFDENVIVHLMSFYFDCNSCLRS